MKITVATLQPKKTSPTNGTNPQTTVAARSIPRAVCGSKCCHAAP
jgi:hypothetical protein